MTPRQRRIIGALVIANCAVILTVVILVVRLLVARSSTPVPSPALPYSSAGPSTGSEQLEGQAASMPRLSQVCQLRAVELLSRAGLGGTVTLASGDTLRLDLVYPIPQDRDPEEAAQQVWTGFDVAQALRQDRCANFSRVTVSIEAQGPQDSLLIRASVDAADLEAYHRGEITESVFIDRVQYEVDRPDGR